MQGYLTNTLLRDVDAMSMAHSLEVRPVLLDYRVAEFAFSLPMHMKLGSTTNKPALVNAVRDLLPDSLVNRRKKGFELPLREWILGPLRERALSIYSSRTAQSIFSKTFLDGTLNDIKRCQCVSYRIWAYMILLEWLDVHDCEL
jgi:asparagine synthase (glutamine-hydrolysing)